MVTVESERQTNEARLFSLNVTPSDPFLEDFWFQNYLGIFRANLVIESAKNVRPFVVENQIELDPTQRAIEIREIVGEAKYLRAFFYFNLVRTFGGVPIKNTVLEIEGADDNFVQVKSTKEQVYDAIEKDLRESILAFDDEIRDGLVSTNFGRIDQGAAMSLLVKVLVYQATPEQPGEKWDEALQFSRHIVEPSLRTPFTSRQLLSFESLYGSSGEELGRIKTDLLLEDSTDTWFLETNSVSLGGKQYNLDFNYAFLNQAQADFTDESIFEVNHVVVPDESINLFSPFYENINHQNLLQPFSDLLTQYPDDPRARIAIMVSGTTLIDGTGVANPPFPEKTACYKWYTIQGEESRLKNFRIMRYAELLLFHAEILNETGDPAGATNALNLVRARARNIGLAGDPRVTTTVNPADYTVSDISTTRTRIRRDRRIELCFEFDRFWDIIRSGQAEAAFTRYNNFVQSFYRKNIVFLEQADGLFPIPQQEIDATGGVVNQNNGYN